jgi:5-methyltetrahydrofolate--homocysteine methyltransferase
LAFIEHATLLKKHGCVLQWVVVMAFDEQCQAATEEEKVRICKRSYDVLVQKVTFPPEDIIFNPYVLIADSWYWYSMEEHANYGVDFISTQQSASKKRVYTSRSVGGISD